MSSQEQEPLETKQGDDVMSPEQQLKRFKRGCLISLMPVWFFLVLGLILLVVFLVSEVERDPRAIEAHVAEFVDIQIPEGFYPFSHNNFMGTEAISYYHRKHVRGDGRTTSVISIQMDRKWRKYTVEELEHRILSQLEARLTSREFQIEEVNPHKIEKDGESFFIFLFRGRQLMDEEILKAVSCFRFMEGPNGPFQVQTMGLLESFPPEEQIAVLSSMKSKGS